MSAALPPSPRPAVASLPRLQRKARIGTFPSLKSGRGWGWAGLFLCFLLLAAPAFAEQYVAYAWTDADLALLYPAGWSAPTPTSDAASGALTLTLNGGATTLTLVVLPVATDDSALRPALEAQVAALDQLPLQYALDPLFGRSGLRIETVSADRQQVGLARSGRLPDDRALLIAGRAPAADQAVFEGDFSAVLNSLVFSAAVPPMRPSYQAVWSVPTADQTIAGIAADQDHLYLVDGDGVRVLDPKTGSPLAQYPFDHPALPTGIALDSSGNVYVGDTLCRCVREMTSAGRWLDPLGSFGAQSPFSLAVAADGTIYATDKGDSGYELHILGQPGSHTVALDFNGSAPPLVTLDSTGQAWVIEWLASLIDGSISGAVSLIGGAKPQASLQFWLQMLTPDKVSALTADPDGNLVLATSDQGVLVVDTSGQVIQRFAQDAPPRLLAFGSDGTLYSARADGTITAMSTRGTPDRFGGQSLTLGVPVQGVLSENTVDQTWAFDGTQGQQVTFSAVDLSRTDAYTLGLDMALRLLAPDGKELAYDDDQQGTDLFGVYDAEIPAFTLPQTGTYTVSVEWRQGQGTYTLGASVDQPLTLSADGVTRVEGSLQDVFPVQRWDFAGHQGEVLTFTMSAEDGTLDPTLALFSPDGTLIAYNDDAADPALKDDAQLPEVRLPADGNYVIEASRYDGVGSYNLVIVNTDQS